MDKATLTIIVPILTSLLTSSLAYLGLRHQYKSDLRKQQEIHKTEIEKIMLQNKNEVEKIQLQLDAQAKLYERNAQTDFTKDVMGQFMSDPNKTLESIQGMMRLAEMANKAKQRK